MQLETSRTSWVLPSKQAQELGWFTNTWWFTILKTSRNCSLLLTFWHSRSTLKDYERQGVANLLRLPFQDMLRLLHLLSCLCAELLIAVVSCLQGSAGMAAGPMFCPKWLGFYSECFACCFFLPKSDRAVPRRVRRCAWMDDSQHMLMNSPHGTNGLAAACINPQAQKFHPSGACCRCMEWMQIPKATPNLYCLGLGLGQGSSRASGVIPCPKVGAKSFGACHKFSHPQHTQCSKLFRTQVVDSENPRFVACRSWFIVPEKCTFSTHFLGYMGFDGDTPAFTLLYVRWKMRRSWLYKSKSSNLSLVMVLYNKRSKYLIIIIYHNL